MPAFFARGLNPKWPPRPLAVYLTVSLHIRIVYLDFVVNKCTKTHTAHVIFS